LWTFSDIGHFKLKDFEEVRIEIEKNKYLLYKGIAYKVRV